MFVPLVCVSVFILQIKEDVSGLPVGEELRDAVIRALGPAGTSAPIQQPLYNPWYCDICLTYLHWFVRRDSVRYFTAGAIDIIELNYYT